MPGSIVLQTSNDGLCWQRDVVIDTQGCQIEVGDDAVLLTESSHTRNKKTRPLNIAFFGREIIF